MPDYPWAQTVAAAVTVCDAAGIILEMNDRAVEMFAQYGGRKLVGANVLDCHPEPARAKLQALLAAPRVNAYTIEQHGVRKLIYQTPWYTAGQYSGLVEFSLELPHAMPHFVRAG